MFVFNKKKKNICLVTHHRFISHSEPRNRFYYLFTDNVSRTAKNLNFTMRQQSLIKIFIFNNKESISPHNRMVTSAAAAAADTVV